VLGFTLVLGLKLSCLDWDMNQVKSIDFAEQFEKLN